MEQGLIAHFPLQVDGQNLIGEIPAAHCRDINWTAGPGGPLAKAASFNGISSTIEVNDHRNLRLGTGDFSIALWLHTEDPGGDVVGDLISKFDPTTRRGFSLGVVTNTGVTITTQANYRNLHFGIDNAFIEPEWIDCGRPGDAAYIASLATCMGNLYAGTFEMQADQVGHLWQYTGDGQWQHLGSAPEGCNCIPSVTLFDSALYVTSGRYNPNGSRLGNANNVRPGGKVYRIEPDGRWIDCGHPGAEGAAPDDPATAFNQGHTDFADEAMSLTVFNGELYVTTNHRYGAYKYEGQKNWKYIGPDHRVMSFTLYHGQLYALINGGGIYRYRGESDWEYCGNPEGCTQVYSAVTYRGDMYIGTWPKGEVYRYLGGERWQVVERVGYSLEVMAQILYNAKVYAGTLPMADVWRMDGDEFTYTGTVDNTPAILRRAWSMAVYQGRLYCGTLPSGRVLSLQAGCMATYDHALKPGWCHVAAVRQGNQLKLFVDGVQMAISAEFTATDFDITNDHPLHIGSGVGHPLRGALCDLQIYNQALSQEQLNALANVGQVF